MSEKMPKSPEQPSAEGSYIENKTEHKERGKNISIPIRTIIDLIKSQPKKLYHYNSEEEIREELKRPIIEFINKEHPEILSVAKKIKANEIKIDSMRFSDRHKYFEPEIKKLLQENRDLCEKITGKDDYRF